MIEITKTDLACAFPCMGCAGFGTEKAIAEADIGLLEAVEFVSRDAKGVVTVKSLTDATKFYGVTTYAGVAGKGVDVMSAGIVNVDGINMDDALNPMALTNDANKNLVLRREV